MSSQITNYALALHSTASYVLFITVMHYMYLIKFQIPFDKNTRLTEFPQDQLTYHKYVYFKH